MSGPGQGCLSPHDRALFPGKYRLFKVGDAGGPTMDGDFVKLMNDGGGRRVDLAVLEMKSDNGAVALWDCDEFRRVLFLQVA